MKITEFLKIVVDAGQETAKGLQSFGTKLDFYLKVIVSVLAAGDVRLEIEDGGMRDIKVKQTAMEIRERLKTKQG